MIQFEDQAEDGEKQNDYRKVFNLIEICNIY